MHLPITRSMHDNSESTQPNDPDGRVFTLAPSDLTFLLRECVRCFWLKIARGQPRPQVPMPSVFTKMDKLQRDHFEGRPTADISTRLPAGELTCRGLSITSDPLELQGARSRIRFRGALDALIKFDSGSYGIVDFKTSAPNDATRANYALQLQPYRFVRTCAPSRRPRRLQPTADRVRRESLCQERQPLGPRTSCRWWERVRRQHRPASRSLREQSREELCDLENHGARLTMAGAKGGLPRETPPRASRQRTSHNSVFRARPSRRSWSKDSVSSEGPRSGAHACPPQATRTSVWSDGLLTCGAPPGARTLPEVMAIGEHR
jgi:hypothetical protein